MLGGGEVAIEVKGTSRLDNRLLRPISSFVDEYHPAKAMVVCNEPEPRVSGQVRILPWRTFLQALWAGDVIG